MSLVPRVLMPVELDIIDSPRDRATISQLNKEHGSGRQEECFVENFALISLLVRLES